MTIFLLDGTAENSWVIVSSIGTILAALAAIVYTILTYLLFTKTSEAAKSSAAAATASAEAALATANAAKQNATANELSVYLSLKKDLTTEIFKLVSKHCRLNTIHVSDIIATGNEFGVEDEILNITQHCLASEVFNNIEDLSIFWAEGVLTIEKIDEGYGYSILYIGRNDEIRRILEIEQQSSVDSYTGFRKMYNKICERVNPIERNNFPLFVIT